VGVSADAEAPPALDVDWISPSLAVGAFVPPAAVERLAREHLVTHVVDLRAEACDEERELERCGMKLLHLPTEDMCAIAPDVLDRGVAWVRHALSGGRRRVLVHCQHGIGRSALLALCVLVDAGMAPLDALALAKGRRAAVSPSPAQLEAFIEFARSHRASSGAEWPIPTFAALAAIAYSHLAGARAR
jgi:protein-tyrosine phosphatase